MTNTTQDTAKGPVKRKQAPTSAAHYASLRPCDWDHPMRGSGAVPFLRDHLARLDRALAEDRQKKGKEAPEENRYPFREPSVVRAAVGLLEELHYNWRFMDKDALATASVGHGWRFPHTRTFTYREGEEDKASEPVDLSELDFGDTSDGAELRTDKP